MSSIRPMPEWCANPSEIARLLRWMHEHDDYGPIDLDTVWEVLEKPWHWDREYSQMCAQQNAPASEAEVEGEERQ